MIKQGVNMQIQKTNQHKNNPVFGIKISTKDIGGKGVSRALLKADEKFRHSQWNILVDRNFAYLKNKNNDTVTWSLHNETFDSPNPKKIYKSIGILVNRANEVLNHNETVKKLNKKYKINIQGQRLGINHAFDNLKSNNSHKLSLNDHTKNFARFLSKNKNQYQASIHYDYVEKKILGLASKEDEYLTFDLNSGEIFKGYNKFENYESFIKSQSKKN